MYSVPEEHSEEPIIHQRYQVKNTGDLLYLNIQNLNFSFLMLELSTNDYCKPIFEQKVYSGYKPLVLGPFKTTFIEQSGQIEMG